MSEEQTTTTQTTELITEPLTTEEKVVDTTEVVNTEETVIDTTEELSKGVAARINKLQEQHQTEIATIQKANEERDNLLKDLTERLEIAEKAKEAAARSANVMELAQKHGVNSSLLSKSGLSGKDLESYTKELAQEIKAAANTASNNINQAALGDGSTNSHDPIKEGLRILNERKAKGKK